MSRQVQKNTRNPFTSLHHSGLIKLLICHELKHRKDSWGGFLAQNQVGIPTMHARVVPEMSSPQIENMEERLFDEDNLPLSEVIARRQRMRELQGEGAATVNRVGLNKPQGRRLSKSK